MKNSGLILTLTIITMFSSFSQTPDWKWVGVSENKNLVKNYDVIARGNAITTDLRGNLYIVGELGSSGLPTIKLGSIILKSNGGYDIFIAKYDNTGKLIWAKSIGGEGFESPKSIFNDSKGNLYITGYFDSKEIKFDETILTGNGNVNIFLAKYDSSGTLLWASQSKGDDLGPCVSNSVTADTSGNIYVTGYFDSPVMHIGNDSLINNAYTSIFLVKYSSSGNVIWAKKADGNFSDVGNGITIDNNGYVYVTGGFASSIIYFDSISLINTGYVNVFIAKYNPNGKVIWAKSAGSDNSDIGNCITTDFNNNVYIAGNFYSKNFIICDTILINSDIDSTPDIFIAKYNKNGDFIWATNPYGKGYEEVTGIANDGIGNTYITGGFAEHEITFGNTTLKNKNEETLNIFAAKYDSSGNTIWAKNAIGSSGLGDEANGIACDTSGIAYITGFLACDTTLFDNILIIKDSDVWNQLFFIAKLSNKADGIEDHQISNEKISVCPNPANNDITIKVTENKSTIEIINYSSQIIKKIQSNNSINHIDISDLQSGLYFIKIIGDKKLITSKFIKL